MARLPRLTLADHPHHIILRGNNRQAIFMDSADYQRMLALLQVHAIEQGVQVHAYVLMSNHLHLLLTPLQNDSLPKMMQAVGRAFVLYFNKRHGRSGTLWEERYKSVIVESGIAARTMAAILEPPPEIKITIFFIELGLSQHPTRQGLSRLRQQEKHDRAKLDPFSPHLQHLDFWSSLYGFSFYTARTKIS